MTQKMTRGKWGGHPELKAELEKAGANAKNDAVRKELRHAIFALIDGIPDHILRGEMYNLLATLMPKTWRGWGDVEALIYKITSSLEEADRTVANEEMNAELSKFKRVEYPKMSDEELKLNTTHWYTEVLKGIAHHKKVELEKAESVVLDVEKKLRTLDALLRGVQLCGA